jgi:Uri superfamily endonuclease
MKGVYILLIDVSKGVQAKIGSLGKIKFEKGIYAYIGSAQNNLEKRIARYKSKNKKTFWHIDYLLNNKYAKILKIFYKKAEKTEECKIVKKLNKTEISVPKFGCSDCSCKSHLFRIKKLDAAELGVKQL